jgi:hypothetical protein
MTEVIVLGAGPAGLLASWGAFNQGAHVTIYDVDPSYRPERIFSLQYMHHPCDVPGVRDLKLHYQIVGPDGPEKLVEERFIDGPSHRDLVKRMYNLKLKRPLDEANSTRFLFDTPTTVWSLRDAYRILYHLFEPSMKRIRPLAWIDVVALSAMFDVIVNTVPLSILRPNLRWPVRTGWIAMDWLPIDLADDHCLYSLQEADPWYRATNLDGGKATEFVDPVPGWPSSFKERGWGGAALQELRKVAENTVLDDLKLNETLPKNLLFTGRWGSWNPKALTHQAYFDTMEMIRCL